MRWVGAAPPADSTPRSASGPPETRWGRGAAGAPGRAAVITGRHPREAAGSIPGSGARAWTWPRLDPLRQLFPALQRSRLPWSPAPQRNRKYREASRTPTPSELICACSGLSRSDSFRRRHTRRKILSCSKNSVHIWKHEVEGQQPPENPEISVARTEMFKAFAGTAAGTQINNRNGHPWANCFSRSEGEKIYEDWRGYWEHRVLPQRRGQQQHPQCGQHGYHSSLQSSGRAEGDPSASYELLFQLAQKSLLPYSYLKEILSTFSSNLKSVQLIHITPLLP